MPFEMIAEEPEIQRYAIRERVRTADGYFARVTARHPDRETLDIEIAGMEMRNEVPVSQVYKAGDALPEPKPAFSDKDRIRAKTQTDCDEQLNASRAECYQQVSSLQKQKRNLEEMIVMGKKYINNLTNDFNQGVQLYDKLYRNKLDLNERYAVLQHENTEYKLDLDELMHEVEQVTQNREDLALMYKEQSEALDRATEQCQEYKVQLDKQLEASNGVAQALAKGYIEGPKTPPLHPPGYNDPDLHRFIPIPMVPEYTPRLKFGAFQVVGNGKPGPLTERQAALYAALHQ